MKLKVKISLRKQIKSIENLFQSFFKYMCRLFWEVNLRPQVQLNSKENNMTDENDIFKYQFYIVKTVRVKWNNNENSFIHVFINTTSIKQFETEKARNEMLQMMFSSVSHEFRTPINAFTNSIFLIESSYLKFLEKTQWK